MARCAKCGKMAGIPSDIMMKDTRTGTQRKVKTDADLVGNKAMLKDQRGMNQKKLSPKNPIRG
jgi:hypothetical protein